MPTSIYEEKEKSNKTLHPTAVRALFEFGLPFPPWMA
jgi:hypothetical protein